MTSDELRQASEALIRQANRGTRVGKFGIIVIVLCVIAFLGATFSVVSQLNQNTRDAEQDAATQVRTACTSVPPDRQGCRRNYLNIVRNDLIPKRYVCYLAAKIGASDNSCAELLRQAERAATEGSRADGPRAAADPTAPTSGPSSDGDQGASTEPADSDTATGGTNEPAPSDPGGEPTEPPATQPPGETPPSSGSGGGIEITLPGVGVSAGGDGVSVGLGDAGLEVHP